MANFSNEVLNKVNSVWNSHKEASQSSQANAAAAMGMNQSAYSQYLRGAIPLNEQFISKFAQLTRTPLTEFGIEGEIPSQDLRTVTLEVKQTLSGKPLKNDFVAVKSLVPHCGCYLVRVDYSNHIFKKGSLLVMDPERSIGEEDTVIYKRAGKPSVYGSVHLSEDGWELQEPHWFGGRNYLVDVNDDIDAIISVIPPESKGAVFKK